MTDPKAEYEHRAAVAQQDLAYWRGRDRAISWARLATMVTFLVLAWLAVQQRALALGWALVPLFVFVALMVVHERVLGNRKRAERADEFFSVGLARLEGDHSAGPTGERYLEEGHLFAVDLDLFGPGSVFQLLSRARTLWGEGLLARWLQEPSLDGAEIEQRQAAVGDLQQRLDLRVDLATLGGEVRSLLEPSDLVAWVTAPRRLDALQPLRFVLPLVALFNGAAALLWAFEIWDYRPLAIALVLESVAWLFVRRRLELSLLGLDRRGRDVELMSDLIRRLDQESFDSERLALLQQGLAGPGSSAAEAISSLTRLIDWTESRRNLFFAPFSALFLVATQMSLALERWRAHHGEHVGRWFETVGQFEALASLASHSYENPADPFPEILPPSQDLIFSAEELGHPLIPRGDCVGNDIALASGGGAPRALIVSGSNMSGKSTFLRACGVNVVLALAGATVRATNLRLVPLTVGASIRTQDSLQDGASRFYAEIVRLRDVLDCARDRGPSLFLLDEILHGTNSHDRKIGASALVKSLVDAGALGLVTTHDLALAEIGDADDRMANVHFVDHLEDGKVAFDYVLREGVVTRSNAVELMREVGLLV
ncbi:MAG: DNA mismatch repair protein MutS [Acidobacteriota bacterium]